MMPTSWVSLLVHAAQTPSPIPVPLKEIDPNVVTPGLVGLAFFVVLFVALFFLLRSFTRQLKKIDIPEGGVPINEPQSSSIANDSDVGNN